MSVLPMGEEGIARIVRLGSEIDFAAFREQARMLLAQGVSPDAVVWRTANSESDLVACSSGDQRSQESRPVPRVSRAFLEEAEAAVLHRSSDRFALIYRLLWRLTEEPRLLALASDPDVLRLASLAKAVRRDIHKMHAFVRFRSIADEAGELYVAWYEPDHHVTEAAAPFFAKRFASMRWMILTPERSAHWTGERLVIGQGASKADAPREDSTEDLWRSYYASTFNPARVNPAMMRAEMPKRFWRNLPEAQLIPDLVETAATRTRRMIASEPTTPVVRRGAIYSPPPVDGDPLHGLAACRACSLWQHATQPVAGEGPTDARLMIVGEQPGDQEDLNGRPFVGPAGQLLDRALAEAGIDRGSIYLTNAVKHFKFEPRGKRRLHKKPDVREIRACSVHLEREFAQVDPEVVVLLGASAAQAVTGRSVAVTRERGRPQQMGGRTSLLTTHPSYILRLPDEADRQQAYQAFMQDLKTAAALLGRVSGEQ